MGAEIKNVCVIGAGAMGHQIALSAALKGCNVNLTDANLDVLASVEKWKTDWLNGRVQKEKLSQMAADAAASRFSLTASLEGAVQQADLVIEAVIEKLDVKRDLFARVDKLAPGHALIVTNSSSFPSSKIADATNRPDKVANLHYFNPALVMELVEVVKGPHTSDETADMLMAFARKTGKTPILVKKEIDGFVANRIVFAISREAQFLLSEGIATFEDIDLAAEKALGHPMGPFRLLDLIGLDVAYFIAKERYEASGLPADKPNPIIEEKYLKGEYGRKAGQGFYAYK